MLQLCSLIAATASHLGDGLGSLWVQRQRAEQVSDGIDAGWQSRCDGLLELIGLRAGRRRQGQGGVQRGTTPAELIGFCLFFLSILGPWASVLVIGDGQQLCTGTLLDCRFELMIGIGRARVWVRMVMIKRTHGCWFVHELMRQRRGDRVCGMVDLHGVWTGSSMIWAEQSPVESLVAASRCFFSAPTSCFCNLPWFGSYLPPSSPLNLQANPSSCYLQLTVSSSPAAIPLGYPISPALQLCPPSFTGRENISSALYKSRQTTSPRRRDPYRKSAMPKTEQPRASPPLPRASLPNVASSIEEIQPASLPLHTPSIPQAVVNHAGAAPSRPNPPKLQLHSSSSIHRARAFATFNLLSHHKSSKFHRHLQ
ncbi:hypothetical protein M0R45_002173 [Rubus argutus]|uniref:Uncharacterized protein n=1 Tax=Rubus argutus TaxID=59490 RepID=A0AAW1VJT6_RUBAR